MADSLNAVKADAATADGPDQAAPGTLPFYLNQHEQRVHPWMRWSVTRCRAQHDGPVRAYDATAQC